MSEKITSLEQALERIEELEKEKLEIKHQFSHEKKISDDLLNVIIPLGTALSAEKDINVLLNKILDGAKGICHADGGTIYIKEGNKLYFKIIKNDSLDIHWDDQQGEASTFPPLQIYDEQSGDYNKNNVATLSAFESRTVSIPDAYEDQQFDFSGTKKFDESKGYRSTSFLTVPLKNHANDVIGVLQLINAQTPGGSDIIPFSEEKQIVVESLSSLAATALENQMLLQAQKDLLDSFIKLISDAIDQKSPYTGGHCKRVPAITEILAKAACAKTEGPFKDFQMNEEQMYELKTAAWLHDIGKITTPEYVVDKATKLETIFDRVHSVSTRMAVIKKELELAYANKKLPQHEYEEQIKTLDDEIAFIEKVNIGGEFMSDDQKEKVTKIAEKTWTNVKGEVEPLLNEDEIKNLCISRGTLTDKERQIINNHIVITIDMLEKLPFPKDLKRVPEYAGGHHEKMDGTGYPKGLTREQMSVPARMMAIADIFEALTASDRPYKKGKMLSEALKIMSFMNKDNHIDPDLYKLFLEEEVYQTYAEQFLDPKQIDKVDAKQYLSS